MTTFGIPDDIPVGTLFKVTFNIGTSASHASGKCFVTGIVDKIQNNIFTTDYTMIRFPGQGE